MTLNVAVVANGVADVGRCFLRACAGLFLGCSHFEPETQVRMIDTPRRCIPRQGFRPRAPISESNLDR